MPLQLLEASYSDMDKLIPIIYGAYSEPFKPFVDLMLPGLGPGPVSREEGSREAASRLLQAWKSKPNEHWLKVIDTETGEIISVSRWSIFTEDVFAQGPPHVEVPWLPEGSKERAYATFMNTERIERVARRCRGPHVWLHLCCTHPKHQRRGAASCMVKWGVDKADELGCDAYMEATTYGRHLYEKFGYVATGTHEIKKRDREHVDEDWKMMEEKWPFTYEWMWRPKFGKYDGKGYPWDDSS